MTRQSIASYDECIRLVSNVKEPYFLRGNAKSGKKDFHGAKQDYDQAIKFKDKPFLSMRSHEKAKFIPNIHYPV